LFNSTRVIRNNLTSFGICHDECVMHFYTHRKSYIDLNKVSTASYISLVY